MTPQPGWMPADVSAKVVSLERKAAVVLDETAEDLAHAECFDPEQRSELYTILEALKADSQAHQEWLGQWVRDIPSTGGQADA